MIRNNSHYHLFNKEKKIRIKCWIDMYGDHIQNPQSVVCSMSSEHD
jgi:hypothetical protein